MHWILEYSPIFFDFDGLLVNTEHLHYQAYKEMMEEYGSSFPWDFPSFAAVAHKSSEGLRKLITDHAPEIVRKKTWEAMYEKKKEKYARLLESGNLELMPGAEAVLETVQKENIPHAVVTNSTRAQTEAIRKKIPVLNRIPHWITREDYEKPKPEPDAYLKAIDVIRKTEKMLGFEDALRGIRALEGAAITPVLICSNDHPQMDQVDSSLRYYPSFKDLLSESLEAFSDL